MKNKISLLLVLLLISGSISWAQQSPVDRLFDKYSGKDGFTSVYISKYMFDLFSSVEADDPDAKEMQKAVSNLNSIRILSMDEPAKSSGVNFYKEVINDLPVNTYKELMVVKEKDQTLKFFIRENGDKISELLLLIGGTNDNTLISISGDIDLKTISKLSKSMKIEGLENLNKVDK
jgi:hypothetical protein